jgi:hypothetical protein
MITFEIAFYITAVVLIGLLFYIGIVGRHRHRWSLWEFHDEIKSFESSYSKRPHTIKHVHTRTCTACGLVEYKVNVVNK